jgi:hypothetical protein
VDALASTPPESVILVVKQGGAMTMTGWPSASALRRFSCATSALVFIGGGAVRLAQFFMSGRGVIGGLIVELFLYYFIGMVISRIGSLTVEPVMKTLKHGRPLVSVPTICIRISKTSRLRLQTGRSRGREGLTVPLRYRSRGCDNGLELVRLVSRVALPSVAVLNASRHGRLRAQFGRNQLCTLQSPRK